jgi:hypothetical protein
MNLLYTVISFTFLIRTVCSRHLPCPLSYINPGHFCYSFTTNGNDAFFAIAVDLLGHQPCPPLHFQVTFIALMLRVEPQPCLRSYPIQSTKADMAKREVNEYLKLYILTHSRPELTCAASGAVPSLV